MKKAAAGADAGSCREQSPGRCAVVVALAWLALAPLARGQDTGPHGPGLADARPEHRMRLELNTSSVPRFDSQDGQGQRLDLAALPAAGSGLGLALGVNGLAPKAQGMLLPGYAPARPSMDVGLRWRQELPRGQVDVTAWRRMSDESPVLAQQQQPTYGARVEMALDQGDRKGVDLSGGFVGVQLEGGARISIKRKNGAPMVYYRSSF